MDAGQEERTLRQREAKQSQRQDRRRLEAINRLFQETQSCNSTAEVASVCLAIAEELTGSQFGFLGELNQNGRVDAIALSPPAWNACKMPAEGAIQMLRDMEIRGIWGKAIRQEAVVIVNDPASDPDWLGLPRGHPTITAFLGVPLKKAGQTIGVIALANRQGGYQEVNRADVAEVVAAFAEAIYRKRSEDAERACRESEQRYRRLLAAVTGYTYKVTFKNGSPATTEHSRGCEKVTGYHPQDYLLDPYLWIKMVHPDDRQMVRLHVARLLACEDVPPMEHRILRKDGTLRWVRDTIVYHCDEDGQLAHYDGMVEDITERKLAEEALQASERQFRSLVETTSDWIWSIDSQGVYTYSSPKVKDLLGYEPEEIVGNKLGTFMLPDEALRVAPAVRNAMDAGKPLLRVEHVNRHKAGWQVMFETSGVPIVGAAGAVLGYQGISRDVTEGKQTQAALKHKELQLLAAQKIQAQLLPKAPPRLPGFDVAGTVHPAEFAAGDYFDYLPMLDGSMGFVIGDVSGHGFAPALIMASTHVLFRSLVESHCDLAEILTLANAVLIHETEDDRFVTLLFCRLDPVTRVLTYASAGHSTAYVFDASGAVKAELKSTALPLAVLADTKFETGQPAALAPGDTVLLLTDGIEEARSARGEPFGRERMLEFVRANCHRTAAELVEGLCAAVRDFSAGQTLLDDTTTVVIKVLPNAGQGRARQ
jgi:sigma-B regulation protein RsbU (phosphoserine phosphatase)